MSKRRKRNSHRTKAFLVTLEGQAWLEAKIKEKHKRRLVPGPNPYPPLRYPFSATINGVPVIVWPDWIERSEAPIHRHGIPIFSVPKESSSATRPSSDGAGDIVGMLD